MVDIPADPYWNTELPPPGFGTGEKFTRPLTIYYFEGRYWVRDEFRWLCNTAKVSDLEALLFEQAKRPDEGSAREAVYPGYIAAMKAEAEASWLIARDTLRASGVLTQKAKPPVTKLTLDDLGI